MITLISDKKNQYKANLHCHSTLSDGKLTPQQLKEAYKSRGYSVLAITDHERPYDHSAMTEEDFLMLTGYEMYIRPDTQCVYDQYSEEIHLNLFARDPANVGIIAYNPLCCKYVSAEEKEKLTKVGNMPQPRIYATNYINETIADAKRNGYIVAYNHPFWSKETPDKIFSYKGCFSMEMCNYSSFVGNRLEYNGALYDYMLRRGMDIACHSADDNHNHRPFNHPASDSFGGFTYILADRLDYDSIFTALENKSFYSSMGPQIFSLTAEGNKVRIKTSPVDCITMNDGSKSGNTVYAENGGKITMAEFTINPRAFYIRFTAHDGIYKADTRGFFRAEYTENR